MTTVYFVRHAEADNKIRDGLIRPLTEKGMADRALVTSFLQEKSIDIVLSSPYRRAVDTLSDFAEKNNLSIHTINDFRERKSDSDWDRDTDYYSLQQRQWEDFNYTLSDGENLKTVQNRNISALNLAIEQYEGKKIAIGTHGTALSTIINYFDNSYEFDDFMKILDVLPLIVKMKFNGKECIEIKMINVLK